MSDESLGTIKSIEEAKGITYQPTAPLHGSGGARQGFVGMLNMLTGSGDMDGYKVETDKRIYYVLISNEQSCCESWGYLVSEDASEQFIGADLREVNLTDMALETLHFERADYYEDDGGVKFVNFVTDRGVFQIAVYNAHNGYYGHSILVARDEAVLLNDTL